MKLRNLLVIKSIVFKCNPNLLNIYASRVSGETIVYFPFDSFLLIEFLILYTTLSPWSKTYIERSGCTAIAIGSFNVVIFSKLLKTSLFSIQYLLTEF